MDWGPDRKKMLLNIRIIYLIGNAISGSLFPWSGGNFNLIAQEGKIWEEPLSIPSPAGGIDLSDQ